MRGEPVWHELALEHALACAPSCVWYTRHINTYEHPFYVNEKVFYSMYITDCYFYYYPKSGLWYTIFFTLKNHTTAFKKKKST